MPDIKKPLATIELITAVVSLTKTAAVVFVMMMLEWARLKERRAKVEAATAVNDLEVERVKTEVRTDARTDKQVVDRFLDERSVPRDAGG